MLLLYMEVHLDGDILRKQQITDRISRNLAEIQKVIPPNKSTVSTRKITWY
jgi:hypothetical protein